MVQTNTKNRIGTMRDYFESEKQLQFPQFLTMISLDSDEAAQLELAKEFLYQSNSDLDKRLALEYFDINQCYHELQYFIEVNKESMNPLNQALAILYQFMLDLKNGKPVHEIRTQSKSVSVQHPELRCLKYFLYIEIDKKVYNYERIGYYLNKIQKYLRHLDNPLFITFFQIRMKNLLFHYYWKRNELILARKNAYEALQMPHHIKLKARLHLDLALSYIYEDFESSVYHIEEAKYIANCLDDQDTLEYIDSHTYPFICAHFGRVEGVSTKDPIERAHLEIARGNSELAISMLEQLDMITPFTQYYLGLATKKQHFFIYSYQYFMEKRSDHFFARLPLKASEGLGI
ncbi:AimR family lysis-lysogeny pheromone receptor [Gracilibacillus lacisalsi]|uniref:AimR family lysis-lysogeny pheromone receptor n=1 Tax=Gracilibacillus lacisalsi TaxID=393087 RepID=UPI00036B47CD|nr:AimR family lysis-lysogeny pheromone receptor [Gracilibacillus lacisalsi]